MPLVRSRVATVSDGWAPCSSQWRARSSSMLIVEGSVCGLYWPMVSIVRPSRGERLSATTMRQIGFFLEPTRLSLIRTAIGPGRLAPAGLWARRALVSARQLGHLLRRRRLPVGHRFHQHFHLIELLDQLVDARDLGRGAVGNPFAAGAVDQPRIGPLPGRHREDDRLDTVELAFVEGRVL